MSDVFISYSRKDAEFVQRLNTAFVSARKVVWIDWQSIPRGEDWWQEIASGVEEADAFIVVLSENWLTSAICHRELQTAREKNKRVLPVIVQQVRGEVEQRVKGQWMDQPYEQTARENWDYLRHLNWIFFDRNSRFLGEFNALLKTLEEDQPHIKAHTRYQTRASEWERSGRNPGFLLGGDDLSFAENWLATADTEKKTPAPTDPHRALITESRRAVDEAREHDLNRERRLQQLRWTAIAVGVIGFLALVATAIAVPTGINALNSNATSNAQVATAGNALVTATSVAFQVATSESALQTAAFEQSLAQNQVATADNALVTATSVALQVAAGNDALATAVVEQSQAQAQVATADTALITATSVSLQVATGESALETASVSQLIAQTEIAVIGATLTPVPPTLTAVAAVAAEAQREQSITARLSSARDQLRNNRIGDAMETINNMVEDYPDAPSAYRARASFFVELQQYEDALADYDRAIELDPQNPNLYAERGNIHSNLGDYEASLADFNYALELSPGNSNIYNSRGFIYINLGDLDAALADFTTAIELDPDNDNAYVSRAGIYNRQGNLEAQLADLTRAIEINPDNDNAYNTRASVYTDLGMYDEAIADYTRAIELEPNFPIPYNNRASLYSALGDLDAAIADYTRVIELDPGYINAYVGRGFAYLNNSDYEAAVADFTYVIQVLPDDTTAYIGRGASYIALGQLDAGIADNTRAIELTPEGRISPDAFINRGWAYFLAGDYETALEDFNRVLRAVPDDVFALMNRGLTYAALGQNTEAYLDLIAAVDFEQTQQTGVIEATLPDINKLIEQYPEAAILYIFRGYLYYALGDDNAALADWTQADDLGGDFPDTIQRLYDQLR